MALTLVEIATKADSANKTLSFLQAASEKAASLCQSFGAITCSVYVFSTDANHLFRVCRAGAEQRNVELINLSRAEHPLLFRHFDHHDLLAASAARLHPATSNFNKSYLVPQGLHSLLALGFYLDGRIQGVVALAFGQPCQWTPQQIESLRSEIADLPERLRFQFTLDNDTRDQLLRYSVEHCQQWMLAINADNQQLIYANQAYVDLEKIPLGALIGRPAHHLKLMESFQENGAELLQELNSNGHIEGDGSVISRDGEELWFRYRIRRVEVNGRSFVLIECQDVTEQHLHRIKLEDLAWRCQLTGALNRAQFLEQVKALELIVQVDINGFRRFNDMNGEAIGDGVLKTLANRLLASKEMLGAEAVYRLGADEFVIGFSAAPNLSFDAMAVELRQRMHSDIVIDEQVYRVQVTVVGLDLSILSEQITPLAALDMAAIEARQGRFYQLYDQQLQSDLLQFAKLEQELRSAVDEEQLVLHYQPLVCGKQSQITGAEALIRWQHPQQGLLFPGSFIEIAERSALIESIGQWVLESALYQLYLWQREWPDFTMHVNVSVKQLLSEEFFELCWHQLTQYKVKPGSFVLEITENTLMEDVVSVGRLCEQLGELGLVLAIDDFGTGYSSMSYLKQLPVQKLKIDRSFVADLEHSVESRQIVPAIIMMGRALNVSITAEGVENTYQEQFLRDHSCDEMQGYHYSKPIPKADLENKLRKRYR